MILFIRKLIPFFAVAAFLVTGCNLKDPVARPDFDDPGNDSNNNNQTNNDNNGTPDGGADAGRDTGGANNGSEDAGGSDVGSPDQGGDSGPDRPPLPASASPTGGTLQGASPNYRVRLQVGAPQAAPRPTSPNHTVEIAPPAR